MENIPDIRTFLEKLHSAAMNIEHLINFTRDYQGIGCLDPVWQDVGEVLQRAVSTLDSSSIQINNQVHGLLVYADPLLEKVLYNLVENAIRHGQNISKITFSYEKRNGTIIIIDEDDGIGVPEDKKEKIFTREYYKNSGLGLFISRDILDITGLLITETGKEGKGARFEILVPKGKYKITSSKPLPEI